MNERYRELKEKNAERMEHAFRHNLSHIHSYPTTIGISLNKACNVKCVFCITGPKSNERVDWHHLKRLESVFPHVKEIILSGEEVLLHPDIWDIFEIFSKNGIYVNFFTNGKALSVDKMEWLVDHNIGHISCSFHAATPDVYHSIVHGADFDTIVKQFLHLKKYRLKKFRDHGYIPGPGVTFHYVMMHRNVEDLPKFLELAARLGADRVIAKYMFVNKYAKDLADESLYYYPELANTIIDHCTVKAVNLPLQFSPPPKFDIEKMEMCNDQAENGTQCHPKEFPKCSWPWRQCNIAINGDVEPCCGFLPPMGNIYKKSFEEIWLGEKYIDLRATVNTPNRWPKCVACNYFASPTDINDIHTHFPYLKRTDENPMPPKQHNVAGHFSKEERLLGLICAACDALPVDFSRFQKIFRDLLALLPSNEADYITQKMNTLKGLDQDILTIVFIHFLNKFQYPYSAYRLITGWKNARKKSGHIPSPISRLSTVENFCAEVSMGSRDKALHSFSRLHRSIRTEEHIRIGQMLDEYDWESVQVHLEQYSEAALNEFLCA